MIRDERSEFKDIVKCHDLTKRIPDDLSAHLFLLGISLEQYRNTLNIIKEIETTKKKYYLKTERSLHKEVKRNCLM